MTALQPYPEQDTIISQIGNEIVIRRPNGTNLCFLSDCTCPSCLNDRNHLNPPWPDLMREWEATRERRLARRTTAHERSKTLLYSLLDQKQQTCLEKNQPFALKSQHGNTYYIGYGYSSNVVGINKRYCCYLNDRQLPIYDHMIGQVLALKYNEDLFLATAY